MAENFTFPTDYRINDINIGETSVVPLFVEIEIFENIFLGGITGSITLLESDAAGFLESEVEFVEVFNFSFTNADGDVLEFDGYLNGLRNKVTKQQNSLYTIDFCSKSVRTNEMVFITKRFNEVPPEDIASEMVDMLSEEGDSVSIDAISKGQNMNFIGSRKKPLEIMKYVLKHGVSENDSSATNEKDTDSMKEEATGTCGFLFWETLDGYRFASVNDLLKGDKYEIHTDFSLKTAKNGASMKEAMLGIVKYEFPQLGDFQGKLRSGAYKSKFISFDIDTGNYKEYTYDANKESNVTTDKQSQLVQKVTRYVYSIHNNERMEPECEKAKDFAYDQTRLSTQQSLARQNSFADQHGRLVLYPHYTIRSGDSIDIIIYKINSDDTISEENKKHSGRYVCKQVSHHIFSDQKSYTKVSVIRAAHQPDQDSVQ